MTSSMRNVVVSGLGLVTCIGNEKETVIRNLRELRHGIRLFPPFQRKDIPVKVAAPIQGFNTEAPDSEDWTYPDKYKIRMGALRSLAPHGLYAYCAMHDAIGDAGLDPEEVSHPRAGLFAASVGSPALLHKNLGRMLRAGPARTPPLSIISSIAGTLNFNLVAGFHIQGASAGFVSACASSGHALGYAFDEITLGRQDRMFVAGAEDCNLENILSFASMRLLTSSADPGAASRPFDRGRDGFVGTGGAVVLVLEEEETARRRGAVPYARLLGWGQASDGHHVAITHPGGRGLSRAMRLALDAARLNPEDVDYINAHATSTVAGDLSEMRALKAVFNNGKSPPLSSTKALTGHGLSLSSIMEAAFCLLAIREGFMPGSAHIENLDPEAGGLNIIRRTREERPRTVVSNSSGFGGANVALVFQAAE